jgi:hypothetical protein
MKSTRGAFRYYSCFPYQVVVGSNAANRSVVVVNGVVGVDVALARTRTANQVTML